MTVCFVAEFSCCVPRCHNMVTDILLCFYPIAKTEMHLCERLQDILLLKWTKHEQSVYDKMVTVYTFSNAFLTFQLEGFKKYDKEAAHHRTHK